MKFADFSFSFGAFHVRPIAGVTINSHPLRELFCGSCGFTCDQMYWLACRHVYCHRCVQMMDFASGEGIGATVNAFCFQCCKAQRAELIQIPERTISSLICICPACGVFQQLHKFKQHLLVSHLTSRPVPATNRNMGHNLTPSSPLINAQLTAGLDAPRDDSHGEHLPHYLPEHLAEGPPPPPPLETDCTSPLPEVAHADVAVACNNQPQSVSKTQAYPRVVDIPWWGSYVVKLYPSPGFNRCYTTSEMAIEGTIFWFMISEWCIFLVVKQVNDHRPLKGTMTIYDLGNDKEKTHDLAELTVDSSGAPLVGGSLWFGTPENIRKVPHSFRVKVIVLTRYQ